MSGSLRAGAAPCPSIELSLTIGRMRIASAFLFVALLFIPSHAAAQATGAITGIVTDVSGGVLPGVTIEVISRDTGQTRTAVTGADGFFTIPLVNPGVYQVKATLSGFRTTIRDGITVVVNETVRADLQLQVGELEEQVTVLGQSPLVETTNATLGVVIDQQKVVDLPLNGRNFTQLGTLIPGVVAPPAGARRARTATPRRAASATPPAASTSTACATSRTTSCSTARRTTTRSIPASCCARRRTRSRNSRSSRTPTTPSTAATPARSSTS